MGAEGGRAALRQTGLDLSDEELAAIDGWGLANRYGSRPEAIRELVRIGLHTEIRRVYQTRSLAVEGDH